MIINILGQFTHTGDYKLDIRGISGSVWVLRISHLNANTDMQSKVSFTLFVLVKKEKRCDAAYISVCKLPNSYVGLVAYGKGWYRPYKVFLATVKSIEQRNKWDVIAYGLLIACVPHFENHWSSIFPYTMPVSSQLYFISFLSTELSITKFSLARFQNMQYNNILSISVQHSIRPSTLIGKNSGFDEPTLAPIYTISPKIGPLQFVCS